ncbi:PREDICTED: LOC107462923 isoform, partial [Prunus dulcis]
SGQHEFVDVEIDEEFGEVEEEVEVESDEAEQGGEDEEEDGDFIDSEFEKSDEEDNMNFHRYVVTEEQDDGHKEPGKGDTDGYNTSDLESLHEDSGDEDGKKRGLRQPKFKQYNKQHDLLDPKFHLDLEFPNMQECREAIKYYACKCARRIRFVKNDPSRVRLVCDGNKKGDKAKRPTRGEKAKRLAKGDKAKRH